jgi:hypothetical protein
MNEEYIVAIMAAIIKNAPGFKSDAEAVDKAVDLLKLVQLRYTVNKPQTIPVAKTKNNVKG